VYDLKINCEISGGCEGDGGFVGACCVCVVGVEGDLRIPGMSDTV
jgi:hypothetical protein